MIIRMSIEHQMELTNFLNAVNQSSEFLFALEFIIVIVIVSKEEGDSYVVDSISFIAFSLICSSTNEIIRQLKWTTSMFLSQDEMAYHTIIVNLLRWHNWSTQLEDIFIRFIYWIETIELLYKMECTLINWRFILAENASSSHRENDDWLDTSKISFPPLNVCHLTYHK